MSAAAALNALSVVSALLDVLQTAQRMLPQFSAEIGAAHSMVRAAQADGRDLTDAETQAIIGLVSVARERAVRAIDAMVDAPAKPV